MSDSQSFTAQPHRSVAATTLLLSFAITLGACQKSASPPPLTDLDLARAITRKLGVTVPDTALLRVTKGDSRDCVDFHRSERTFAQPASRIDAIGLLAMRMHLRSGYSNWHPPGQDGRADRRVDGPLERVLRRASARAMLRINAQEASDPADKPWPKTCRTTFWFAKPVYVDDIAFADAGSKCGGLCGSGEVYAFEYRDRRWTFVATAPTWIA